MFNRKEKKAATALNKVMTLTGLLKAALAFDQDAMTAMVTGQTADDEGLRFTLETLLMVAHRNPAVIAGLEYVQTQVDPKANVAFTSGIRAARAGQVRLFSGGSITGQGLFLIHLAMNVSQNDAALADAMATAQMFAQNGGR
jgi:hypothetical protein